MTEGTLPHKSKKKPMAGILAQKPRQTRKNETHTYGQIPNTKPKRDEAAALGEAEKGKTGGMGKPTVSFAGYRVRPCDPDNFAASCKDLLDGLRHAGLIPGDEPWRIVFETEQIKVNSYSEEKTMIYLDL